MNSTIKYIFIDVDWTILSHSYKPPRFDKRSLRYLRSLQKKGVEIIVSTARPYASLSDIGIFKYLKPDGYILSCGSLIIYKDEVIKEDDISMKDFEILSKIALKYKGNLEGIRVYDSFLIREMNDPVNYVFMAFPSKRPVIEGIHRKKVNKATLYFYKEDYEEIMSEVPKHLHYFRFHDNAVDVSHKMSSKGSAVHYLMDKVNISKDQCVAIGDELTDVSMFSEVKYGIAMGSASDEVKQYANIITKDVNHHGVKYALKHLIK